MAGMTVGELTGFIDLEDKGFASELRAAENSLGKLQSSTSSKTASIESTVTKSFHEVEQAIKEGLNPTEAIADLDRLEAEIDATFAAMAADADTFAAELEAEIDKAFASLDDDAKESGKRAGQDLADGLKDGLADAKKVARKSGEDSGKEFGDGVEDSGGGKGGGGRMAGIGSTLVGGLKAGAVGLAAAAGAAIGGMLIDGIKTAMEREDLFATLAVKVGAFGAESERLGTIAGDLYADAYGESLGDVTDALARVLQNMDGAGKLGDDALKAMTAQALTVAKVMDEDVSAVTRAVSQMLRNDLAPSAKDAFDILVRGQQDGVNKSEDLLDTFNEYSTIFRDLGLSGKDALGLLSQGLKAGARDSDTVADALKELDIRVKDMSAAPALKALGLNAKEMADAFAKGGPKAREALQQILEKLGAVEDPAKRSQLAVALFGTKAEDMAKSINSLNLDQAKTAVGSFKDAVTTADQTLGDTASASADKWSRSWENVFSALGEQAMVELKKMFPSPADMEADWNEFTAWFDSSVGPFFADAWASVSETTVDAWNGIVEWLQGVPTKIQESFVSGWNDLKSNTAESWEGIKSSATKKADELVSWVQGIPGKIGGFFSSGWADLQADTATKWEGIKSSATKKATELVSWLQGLPGKIKAGFAAAGTWLLQAGRDLINGMINGVREKAGELVTAAQTTVQSAVNAAKNLLGISSPSKVFAEIGKWTVAGLVQGLTDNKSQAVDVVTNMVGEIKQAFASQPDVADGLVKFVSIGNDSLAALAKKRDAIVSQLAAAKEMAKQVAGTAQEWADITGLKAEDFTGAGDIAAELRNKASAINNFANNIQTLAKRGLNKKIIQDIIDAGVEKGATFAEMLVGSDGSEIKALNKAQQAVDKASKKLGKSSADAMFDVGKKSGDGYLKGLQESLKALDKEMKKIVDALVKAIKKELKIKSPSQVMADIGVQTMTGLVAGMQAMSDVVRDTATSLVNAAMTSATQAAASGMGSLGMFAGSIGKTPGMAGLGMQGVPYKTPPAQTAAAAGGTPDAGGVTVNMYDTQISSTVDVATVGQEFAFEYMARA